MAPTNFKQEQASDSDKTQIATDMLNDEDKHGITDTNINPDHNLNFTLLPPEPRLPSFRNPSYSAPRLEYARRGKSTRHWEGSVSVTLCATGEEISAHGSARRKRDLAAFLMELLSGELKRVAERWKREGVRTRQEIADEEERRRAEEREEREKRSAERGRRRKWWGEDALTDGEERETERRKERWKKKEEKCTWWRDYPSTGAKQQSSPKPTAEGEASSTRTNTTNNHTQLISTIDSADDGEMSMNSSLNINGSDTPTSSSATSVSHGEEEKDLISFTDSLSISLVIPDGAGTMHLLDDPVPELAVDYSMAS